MTTQDDVNKDLLNNKKNTHQIIEGSFEKIISTPSSFSEISIVSNPLIKNEIQQKIPTNKIITSFYNKYNFIPYNLYVQFSKSTNLFFLSVLILLLIPKISPFSPFTYIIALLIVILASMLKDAFEDKKRHNNDFIMNNKIIKSIKIKENKMIIIDKTSEFVHKNEFILLKKGEEVPADGIIILSFSSIKYKPGIYKKGNIKYKKFKYKQKCKGFSYIETSKIDGESALKKKYSNINNKKCKCTSYKYIKKSEIDKIKLTECLKKILLKIKKLDLSEDNNLILEFCNNKRLEKSINIVTRGMIIESENVVILIYKTNENIKSEGIRKLSKISTFTKDMERYLLVVFGIFFLFLIISLIFLPFEISQPYYFINRSNIFFEAFKLTLTNYTILSFVVPLSLCVMLEIARIFFKLYLQNLIAFCKSTEVDLSINSLYDLVNLNKNVTNFITIRNTHVIEQLGSTETIITDKTGTLTLNKMIFKYCYINIGKNKINNNDIQLIEDIISFINKKYLLYLLLLICCNSVYISDGDISGTSTDEISIIKKLLSLKNKEGDNIIIINEKDDKIVKCILFNNKIKVKIFKVFEFTSKRRKMVILMKIIKIKLLKENEAYKILKNIKKEYILFSKGSRNAINCNSLEIPNDFIYLRELVLAYKYIKKEDVLLINKETINKNKGKKFEEIYNSKLKFLGLTLVEDTLQPDLLKTLSLFRDIFIVTGDKRGTAIGVAKSMNMKVIWAKTFNEITDEDLKIIPDDYKYPYKYFVKESIKFDACSDDKIYKKIDTNSNVECRIFYNVLPDQKGEIVKKIQNNNSNVLAIGDGFNDIPMLKEASIGVGLKGEEGTAASNTADVSATSFNCLIPLVYISRQAYLGFTYLTFNAIMKNIYLMGIQMILFLFTNGSIFNSEFIAWFNVLFTSLITFSESCGGRALLFNMKKRKKFLEEFENRQSDNLFPNILEDPSLRPIFSHTKCKQYFLFKKFVIWVIFSIIKSIIIFFTTYYLFDKFIFIDLKTVEILFSYIVFIGVIMQQLSTVTNINYYLIVWTVFSFVTFLSIIRSFYIFKYFIEIAAIISLGVLVDIIRAIVIEKTI